MRGMKQMSLKWKITLWYAGILFIMVGLLFLFLFCASERMARSESVSRLEERVWDFVDEIELEHGTWELDDDVRFYESGVTFSLYDDAGRLIAGSVPRGFPEQTTLKSYVSQRLSGKQGKWNVYDAAVPCGNGRTLWVRGIDDVETLTAMERIQRNLLLIICPLLALVALAAGYLITRRALLPAEEIRRTAEEIGESGDLSRRIATGRAGGELRLLADTFNQMFMRLEDAFEKERQFTSDASHELRTPLSVIRSEAEYALLPDVEAWEQREGLEVILEQAEKMSALISQLLMLARADSGREKLKRETADLGEIAASALESVRVQALERGIALEFKRDPVSEQGTAMEPADALPCIMVNGDRESLCRAIGNLIENAVQYGKDGGWVRVTVCREGELAVCKVEDNGIGIGEADIPRIWNRFYRVDAARETEKGNSGLGLSIVKWIIEEHGGRIKVESTPGQGSCFAVYLPVFDEENSRV